MIPTLPSGRTGQESTRGYKISERWLGDWIRRYGSPFFLATKTNQRTRQAATEQIHRSLDRLHFDHVDMAQIHAPHEEADWQIAFSPG